MKPFRFWPILLSVMITPMVNAQEFDVSLQWRPRYEYRNGYKNFLQENQKPASLISQRTRLNLNYINNYGQVYLSLHNNGVWGENDLASNTSKSTVSVFEAWFSYRLNNKITLKMGRQQLSYDNQRILGRSDWGQQGLSHDAVRLQFKDTRLEFHTGWALNNTEESSDKKAYVANNYKNLQYIWANTNVAQLNLSVLLLNTGYEFTNDYNELTMAYQQTWGTFLKYKRSNLTASAALYGQTGKWKHHTKEAWYAFADFNYKWNEIINSSVGYEYLSGTHQNTQSKINRSFAPLLGSNHSFNGAMDYFNNSNFQNSVGLHDFYLNGKAIVNKWHFEVTPHVFYADKNILGNENSSLLGTEIDLTANYKIQEHLKVTAGYSQLFATEFFENLRNSNLNTNNQWAWLMITFEPSLFNTKK